MCHYDGQRTWGIPHTARGQDRQAHHRFEKFIPPRGKIFNPFVAFCRSKKKKKRIHSPIPYLVGINIGSFFFFLNSVSTYEFYGILPSGSQRGQNRRCHLPARSRHGGRGAGNVRCPGAEAGGRAGLSLAWKKPAELLLSSRLLCTPAPRTQPSCSEGHPHCRGH